MEEETIEKYELREVWKFYLLVGTIVSLVVGFISDAKDGWWVLIISGVVGAFSVLALRTRLDRTSEALGWILCVFFVTTGIYGKMMRSDVNEQREESNKLAESQPSTVTIGKQITERPTEMKDDSDGSEFDKNSGPPMPFVHENVCPFECCTFREWAVLKNGDVYESPLSFAKPVASITVGDVVQGHSGSMVVTSPGIFRVVRNYTSEFSKIQYKKDDLVYVLSYEGEGIYRVWMNGKYYTEEAWFYGVDAWDACMKNQNCWGEVVKREENEWWVNITTPRRETGWSKVNGQFGNMDACG